jgi:peptidoglycan hydrolase FlgJ
MSIGSISSRADHRLAAQARLVNQCPASQQSSPLPGARLSDLAAAAPQTGAALGTGAGSNDQGQVREKFDAFVGQSFYGQLLHEMHKTVGKVHYFNGGRAEEAFQGQLDQVLSENMARANAGQFTGPMFELFNAQMQATNRR